MNDDEKEIETDLNNKKFSTFLLKPERPISAPKKCNLNGPKVRIFFHFLCKVFNSILLFLGSNISSCD